jgi:hypothetical protein
LEIYWDADLIKEGITVMHSASGSFLKAKRLPDKKKK